MSRRSDVSLVPSAYALGAPVSPLGILSCTEAQPMRTAPFDSTRPSVALLPTPKAAAYIGMSVRTMNNWRWLGAGRGPAFVRLGRSVRYDVRTLDAWIAARTFDSTSLADHGAP